MAEEDVPGGMAAESDSDDSESASEWVAPEFLPSVVPLEETDEEPPPDAEPTFLVALNKYGPGAHSIRFADGTPVGVWLSQEHPDKDGLQIKTLLIDMGMPEPHADWLGAQRAAAIAAVAELRQRPEVKAQMLGDALHDEKMEHFRAQFLKEQKQKGKEQS